MSNINKIPKQFPNSEVVKIIIFSLIQASTCIFLIGIIPTIILVVGYLLTIREKKTTTLITSIKIVIWYTVLLTFIAFIGLLWSYTESDSGNEYLILSLISFLLCGTYLLILYFLFQKPVEFYGSLLEMNSQLESFDLPQLSVINKEKNKTYSVADELLKWKELKDTGVISEEGFIQMRKKILKLE